MTGADGPPRIWVDADAAPRDVKDIVARAALRLELPAFLVANQRLQTPANNPFVSSVRVAGGPDVADDHIADNAEPGDLAITADIPLASRLVEKGVKTLDPRGTEYTRENIGERLSIRDFMDQLRSTGVETGGPSSYGATDKQAFAAAFDRMLTRLTRKR
ncbi:MAG TPA: YaiI/YqxD family protein [Longimicrobiales bacterium]|nr:YaiI/YqxD family protein [Longimicrobiales bacterium]